MTATAPRERPIIFSPPSVRAILDGRKTQSRRVVKPQPPDGWDRHCWFDAPVYGWTWEQEPAAEWHKVRCPYGVPGDRLWCITLKPLAFGDGKYAAGDDGHIYDISGHEPRRRRVAINGKGYEEISLRAGGEQKHFRVNRLVAEAFYGPPPEGMTICRHLDGLRRNNRPDNLDWGTEAQNTADANAAGAWSGSANGGARLSPAAVESIRASHELQAVLADRHSVTQSTISKIKSGKRWRTEHPTAPEPNAPRWASRITLELTAVRVQRLQEMSHQDAVAEGWPGSELKRAEIEATGTGDDACIDWYADLWDETNAKRGYPWDSNPFVWCLSFRRIEL